MSPQISFPPVSHVTQARETGLDLLAIGGTLEPLSGRLHRRRDLSVRAGGGVRPGWDGEMRRVVHRGQAAWRWIVTVFMEKVADKLVTAAVMAALGGGGLWWSEGRVEAAKGHEKESVKAVAVTAMKQGMRVGQALKKPCPHNRRTG